MSRVNQIDAYVGLRIRERRAILGMSQSMLAKALGVTFQQVQKYERGLNRVGAGRLFILSRILGVQIGFFYEDIPQNLVTKAMHKAEGKPANGEEQEEYEQEPERAKRETLELVRAYYRLPPDLRKGVRDLVRSVGESYGSS